MKSFGILRTNVGLTTNVKIMVDSNYNLSLDSIDSNAELTNSKYKKFSFIKENYFDELVPYFWDGINPQLSYYIKYNGDNDSMSSNFADQYDEIYQYGARNIIDNKNYTEEYEYFAPLYIKRGSLPSNFIIFRVDGIGLLKLDKTNFTSEILNKLKTVKVYDLTKKTHLGEWLDNNFVRNDFFPDAPFEMNFRRLEFSKWNGIDYKSGGYITKSLFLDDYLEKENEIFNFEKLVFDNFKNNSVIFPHILNLSFLFDDNPANSEFLRKWSINRYYGFYLNSMDVVKVISPYKPPKLKTGVTITSGNVLNSLDGLSPFVTGWDNNKIYYVEYNGEYHKVEKYTETTPNTLVKVQKGKNLFVDEITTVVTDKWRIISKIDLSGKESLLNINSAIISNKKLVDYSGNKIIINQIEVGDVYIIEIDGVYHNLVKDSDGYLKIVTDYDFKFTDNTYSYFINSKDPSYTTTVDFTIKPGEEPKKFTIYRLNFTDIKDFDDRIVDTEYSKFEYEKFDELTTTDETKMYLTNLNSNVNPPVVDQFTYENSNVHIPVSSEYISSQEIFKIENDDLTPLWRKNSVYCRWAFANSISANDVPYLLNNSRIFERFNRTTNPYEPDVHRVERNLDYFYTINSSTASYLHHTLHVENNNSSGLDLNWNFDFNKYKGLDTYITGTNSVNNYNFDYFTWFFERKSSFLSNKIKKNVLKYSTFNRGDKSSPNLTLFRGIKFTIHDIENIRKSDDGQIEVVNTKTSNNYEDYKFSILLTTEDNGMQWQVIDNWEMEKIYASGSVIIHDDILYVAKQDTVINEPEFQYNSVLNISGDNNSITSTIKFKSTPYRLFNEDNIVLSDLTNPKTLKDWDFYYDLTSPFWNPFRSLLPNTDNKCYKLNDIVYRDGDWYYNINTNVGVIDFWNPIQSLKIPYVFTPTNTNLSNISGYNKDSLVIYKGEIYRSNIDNNHQSPDNTMEFRGTTSYTQKFVSEDQFVDNTYYGETWMTHWSKVLDIGLPKKWAKIDVWNPSKTYNFNNYITHDNIVYLGTYSNPTNNFIKGGEEPGISVYWKRVYSLEQDTNFVYGTSSNPYLIMNNSVYKLTANPLNKTLENGVRIFVNKNWRNILVNIFVNDNTLTNLKNSDRDTIYHTLYKKLTANNFCNVINNLTNKHDFSDYIKYIIIDGNTISEYDLSNVDQLPLIIYAEKPETLDVQLNSLIKQPIIVDKLKPIKNLTNGFINNISELNYYDGSNIAVGITENLDPPLVVPHYHGITNIVNDVIFRYSGDYMPLFYDIDIFKKDNSLTYKELQLVFYTDTNDDFNFTFTLDGVTETKSFYVTKDNYYDQIINIIYNYFNGIDFIFEKLTSGSYYISNNITTGYDVLSVKWRTSNDIKVSIKQIPPKLLFDIEDASGNSNITVTLSATSGHPPYNFAWGYVSGTSIQSLSAFTTSNIFVVTKPTNGDTKIKFEIYTKDSYGINSSGGIYTLNSGLQQTSVDSIFYYEWII